MKLLIVLIAISLSTGRSYLFAQGNVSETTSQKHLVCNFLINPREYPDDARRPVKPPTWEFFGNQTHFTAMRSLKIKDGRLVNFAENFERYSKTYDLGDVIWPNSSFLSATNIPDMVREMKHRNLYLL